MDVRPPAALILVALGLVAGGWLLGCESSPPQPSAQPSASPARPTVGIDQTWTATDDEWTITGSVDPQGEPTDVVLEIGPGPATARRFDTRLPVEEALTTAATLTITTRDIPDVDEICVRFTATSSAGTSSSQPLCIPHDLPTFNLGGSPGPS